jgi:methylated-DNA-[protein]-cysteine S-methyltransferase
VADHDVGKPAADPAAHAYIEGMIHYAVFETVIGWAGVAWAEQGLVGAHLPENDPAIVRASFARRFPQASEAEPSPPLTSVVDRIVALMHGEKVDLSDAPSIWRACPNSTRRSMKSRAASRRDRLLTYGQIAVQLGDRLLAQQVGAALGKNPWPILVPCHRVTAANGKLGGFSARGGAETKLRLLAIEGASAAAQADLFGQPPAIERTDRANYSFRVETGPDLGLVGADRPCAADRLRLGSDHSGERLAIAGLGPALARWRCCSPHCPRASARRGRLGEMSWADMTPPTRRSPAAQKMLALSASPALRAAVTGHEPALQRLSPFLQP